MDAGTGLSIHFVPPIMISTIKNTESSITSGTTINVIGHRSATPPSNEIPSMRRNTEQQPGHIPMSSIMFEMNEW